MVPFLTKFAAQGFQDSLGYRFPQIARVRAPSKKRFRRGSQVTQSWFPQDFQVKVPNQGQIFPSKGSKVKVGKVPAQVPARVPPKKWFRQGSQVTQSWFPQDFQVKFPNQGQNFPSKGSKVKVGKVPAQVPASFLRFAGLQVKVPSKVMVALAKYPTRFPSKMSQVEVPPYKFPLAR